MKDDDPMSAAQGCFNGFLLGSALWILGYVLVQVVL